ARPVGYVDHMTRFKPFVTVNKGNELERIFPPGEHIPGDLLIMRFALRLKGKRMSTPVGCERDLERYAILRIAVDAIDVDGSHEFCNGIGPWFPRIPRSLIPHHH